MVIVTLNLYILLSGSDHTRLYYFFVCMLVVLPCHIAAVNGRELKTARVQQCLICPSQDK
jgi:hypothetical protein